jgi:hypothetical protein
MKYVTAQESQNMMPLLQQSAKLHKIILQTEMRKFTDYQSINLVYYSTVRNI